MSIPNLFSRDAVCPLYFSPSPNIDFPVSPSYHHRVQFLYYHMCILEGNAGCTVQEFEGHGVIIWCG